ncbi:hypothetical protein ILUMI_06792, partial [Ignelater luminosus]
NNYIQEVQDQVISSEEFKKASKKVKIGKAPAHDGITAEMLELFNKIIVIKTKYQLIGRWRLLCFSKRKGIPVKQFKYLGSWIMEDRKMEAQLDDREQATTKLYFSLNRQISNKKELYTRIKTRIFNVLHVPVSTYGSETWTLSKNPRVRIQVIEMKVLRRIAGLKLIDKVRNTKIRRTLGVRLIEARIRVNALRSETAEKVWQMGRVEKKFKSR